MGSPLYQLDPLLFDSVMLINVRVAYLLCGPHLYLQGMGEVHQD